MYDVMSNTVLSLVPENSVSHFGLFRVVASEVTHGDVLLVGTDDSGSITSIRLSQEEARQVSNAILQAAGL